MGDNRDIWMLDTRPIVSAVLGHGQGGRLLTSATLEGFGDDAQCGWTFERFERNGEMAAVPYLRASKPGKTFEAPLRNWEWVEFGDHP